MDKTSSYEQIYLLNSGFKASKRLLNLISVLIHPNLKDFRFDSPKLKFQYCFIWIYGILVLIYLKNFFGKILEIFLSIVFYFGVVVGKCTRNGMCISIYPYINICNFGLIIDGIINFWTSCSHFFLYIYIYIYIYFWSKNETCIKKNHVYFIKLKNFLIILSYKMLHFRCLACLEYAPCSEYVFGSDCARVLNIPEFWMCLWFWIHQCFEYTRFPQSP